MPDRTRTRICLVSDIEHYSKHTTAQQADAQRRLARIMRFACAAAGVHRVSRRFRQDRGDGVLLLLPPEVDPTVVLPALLQGFRHALYLSNREPGGFGRLRLRVAVAQGAAGLGRTGFTGPAPTEVCRLVDAPRLRELLARERGSDLAFIMTDALYEDVGRQDFPGLPTADFQRLEIIEDKYRGGGWVCLPTAGPATVGLRDARTWPAVAAIAGAVAVAGPSLREHLPDLLDEEADADIAHAETVAQPGADFADIDVTSAEEPAPPADTAHDAAYASPSDSPVLDDDQAATGPGVDDVDFDLPFA